MKVEIAESLFLSWLRHVRGCRIVQLNWKPSQTWDGSNSERVELLFKNSREYFFQECSLDLYGKNSSVSQLVQQGEIDALGICNQADRRSIIAVDVAFHEAGLNYGDKGTTTARVVKKILRTLLALESYFPEYPREIIFAAPKIHHSVHGILSEAMIAVDRFFEQNEIAAECRLIANADFFAEVVEPVKNLAIRVADTSELFMRSVQLIEMDRRISAQPLQDNNLIVKAKPLSSELPVKIGELVRETFQALFEQNRLSDVELERLCTLEYSKRSFGLRYPVLRRSKDRNDRFDSHGSARFYAQLFGGEYLLCNDWYERNRERFVRWLNNLDGS